MSKPANSVLERLDITDKIGPLFGTVNPSPEWPMYSFERPSWILWNAIANELHQQGMTEAEIGEWLQSKSPRWALDGILGEMLEKVAKDFVAMPEGPR